MIHTLHAFVSSQAQLRAHIYTLVDDDPATEQSKTLARTGDQSNTLNISTANSTQPPAATSIAGEDESIALSLVQDLLDCMNLSYTSSVLRAELRQTYAHWPRRRIADVLQIDLDDPASASSANSSADASSSHSIVDEGPSTNHSQNDVDEDSQSPAEESAKPSTQGDLTSASSTSPASKSAAATVPLLVEILRRLPKTTDESSASTSALEADDSAAVAVASHEINNDTFVALSRSANMTSESL